MKPTTVTLLIFTLLLGSTWSEDTNDTTVNEPTSQETPSELVSEIKTYLDNETPLMLTYPMKTFIDFIVHTFPAISKGSIVTSFLEIISYVKEVGTKSLKCINSIYPLNSAVMTKSCIANATAFATSKAHNIKEAASYFLIFQDLCYRKAVTDNLNLNPDNTTGFISDSVAIIRETVSTSPYINITIKTAINSAIGNYCPTPTGNYTFLKDGVFRMCLEMVCFKAM